MYIGASDRPRTSLEVFAVSEVFKVPLTGLLHTLSPEILGKLDLKTLWPFIGIFRLEAAGHFFDAVYAYLG